MFSRVYSGSLNLFKLGRPSNLVGIQSRTFHYTCDPKTGHGKVFFCSDNSSDLSKDVTVIPSITKEQVTAHCTLRKDVLKTSLASRTVLSNLMYHNVEKSEALVLGLKTRFKEWYPKWRKAHLTESDDVWFSKIAQKLSEILYPCFNLLKHSIKEDLGLFNHHSDILLDSLWINEQGEKKEDGEFVVPYPLICDSSNDRRKEAGVIGSFVFAIVNKLPIERFGDNYVHEIKNHIYTNNNTPHAVKGYLYFLVNEFDPEKHNLDVALSAPILLMGIKQTTQLILNTYKFLFYASTLLGPTATTNALKDFEAAVDELGPPKSVPSLPTQVPITPPSQSHPYYLDWHSSDTAAKNQQAGATQPTQPVATQQLSATTPSPLHQDLRALARVGHRTQNRHLMANLLNRNIRNKYDLYFGTILLSRDVIIHYHDFLEAQKRTTPFHPDKVILMLEEHLNVVWLVHRASIIFVSNRTWMNDELEFFKTFVGYLPRDDHNIWASETRFSDLK